MYDNASIFRFCTKAYNNIFDSHNSASTQKLL